MKRILLGLAVAAAAVLLVPSSSMAQGHGHHGSSFRRATYSGHGPGYSYRSSSVYRSHGNTWGSPAYRPNYGYGNVCRPSYGNSYYRSYSPVYGNYGYGYGYGYRSPGFGYSSRGLSIWYGF